MPLFMSLFQSLLMKKITVEMKNDAVVTGILQTVDHHLNLYLENVETREQQDQIHLEAAKFIFVRGSTIRYIHLCASDVDVFVLEDTTRRDIRQETDI
ncbi:putative snrna-associated sm class [Blattamonas nauphoetae]|uniref:Snrna-associated sm class n=1 Tax=Blattamonas nauphoetae TaxID=2049346 RepID=A0ABQ9Y6E1_9EUKA|nr:putative snrna-associated sm class [Blattamonas nauphoetae]